MNAKSQFRKGIGVAFYLKNFNISRAHGSSYSLCLLKTTKKMQYSKKSNNQCYKSKSQVRLWVSFT